MVSRRHGVLILAALVTSIGLVAFMAPAQAATGDVVSTIIAVRDPSSGCASTDPSGEHDGIGTGIAFDGTNLILSCWGSAALDFVNPTTGAFVKTVTPTGGSDFGAMAYDVVHQRLWVCNDDDDVGVVDLVANTFTVAFPSDGCVDGLAYDGTDNTVWSSADVASSVQHYQADGTPIASFPVDLGGVGSSGLAVGGATLYLGNNGGAEIWQSDKTLAAPTVFIDSVKTGDRRVEDLECDNVTFSASGRAVIWSQDAYDNILNAYEIPDGVCSFGGITPTTTTTTTEATTTTTVATTAPPTTVAKTSPTAAAPVAASPKFAG